MKTFSSMVVLKFNLIFHLKVKMVLITTFVASIFFLIAVQGNSQISPVYDVYAISFTRDIRQAGKWIAVRNAPDSIDMRFMVWLLKGNNGKNILVDAGYIMSDSALKTDKTGYIRPDLMLQKMKIQADDITDIIISHPHWDHIGGIELFPKATVWMQKDDYDYFVGSAWQKGGVNKGFDKKDVQKIVNTNLQGRLNLIKGDNLEIIPGIRVFIGSKHTYESQFVQVTTGKEKIIIASDNIWFYYNFDNLLPITLTFDTTAYVNQMKRMKFLASDPKLIIPGHDMQIFTRFPKVADGVVRISGNK